MANAENGAWEGIERCLDFPYQWALGGREPDLVVPPCQRICPRQRRFWSAKLSVKLAGVTSLGSVAWQKLGRLN